MDIDVSRADSALLGGEIKCASMISYYVTRDVDKEAESALTAH